MTLKRLAVGSWRRARTAFCVAAGSLLTLVGRSSLSAQPTNSNLPLLRGFAAKSNVNLRVFVPAGQVRVVVWDRDSIAVSGTIGTSSSMFGGGRPDYVKFGVEPMRVGDTRLASADWVVTVPRKAHVWVKMTDGAIETEGTTGELELYSVGGSIRVRRAKGVISVESIDAAVSIDGAEGDLRVRGGKASLNVRNATGTASITSVSGNVSLTGTAPECRVETIGGSITLDVADLRGALVELQSHAGAIHVNVGAEHMPQMELASRTGTVTQPKGTGAASNGKIVARSFKGAITVTATAAARR